MSKQISITIGIFVVAFALIFPTTFVRADSAYSPECLDERYGSSEDFDLGKKIPATCKQILIDSKIESSANFINSMYGIKSGGRRVAEYVVRNLAENFSQFDVTYLIDKAYFDKNFKGISTFTFSEFCDYTPSPVCEDKDIEDFLFTQDVDGKTYRKTVLIKEFGRHLISFTYPRKDSPEEIARGYALPDISPGDGCDGGRCFVVSIVNPLKKVEVTYKSSNVFSNNTLALYRIKQVDYFNDGSKKEMNFPLPPQANKQQSASSSVQNALQQNSEQVNQPQSTIRLSFWSRFSCFFKRLFGGTC